MLIPLVMLTAASLFAADDSTVALRSRNLLINPGFEQDQGWTFGGDDVGLDTAAASSGGRALRFSNEHVDQTAFARQVITLDPPIEHPFRISGWSRAENVDVGQDYNIYLDLEYADGTPLWGQMAHFNGGSHDWEQTDLVFDVAKPVRKIEVFVFLRKGKGTVWFDDLEIGLAPFSFRGLRVLPDVFGPGSVGVSASTTLPASWTAAISGQGRQVSQARGARMPLRIDWGTFGFSAAGEVHDPALGDRRSVWVRPSCMKRKSRSTPVARCGAYAVWTEDSMRRVMPYEMPPERLPSTSSAAEIPPARISLARREYESFQIALLAAKDVPLEDVRVEVTDLVSPTTGGRIPSRQIEWHQVGYVRVDRLRGHPADSEAVPGWWPEMLLPVEQFDVPGRSDPVALGNRACPARYSGRRVSRQADDSAGESCAGGG